jgi:protein-S-isoprenylcysteine O-methyltransferase Ste14
VLRTISIISLLFMALALIGLAIRGALFSLQPIAIVLEVTAAVLMIWARVTFGSRSFHAAANPTSGGLITTGPYRFIRHPIYTAICLFAWSGILTHWTIIDATLGTLLLLGAVARILCEEKMLVEIYPAYREYAQSTKRMLPFIY